MNKATPVQLRQGLEAVEALKQAGIRFVPMPVLNDEDFEKLTLAFNNRLENLAILSEQNENNSNRN